MLTVEHTFPEWPSGFTAYAAAQLLDGLANAYLPWYALNPLPPLYSPEARMRYAMEPGHGGGREEFANPWVAFSRGWGDCDDLVLWRLLELRFAGESAAKPENTRAIWKQGDVHVLVRRRNGEEEDPSLILLGRQQGQWR